MSVSLNVDASDAFRVAREIDAASGKAAARATVVVRHHGQLLLTRIKGKARGRPGPRVVTGDYNRSWSLQLGIVNGGAAAVAGTNADQGRRLELGFVGEDALGRYYDQPPYEHAGPALDETEPGFTRDVFAIAGW